MKLLRGYAGQQFVHVGILYHNQRPECGKISAVDTVRRNILYAVLPFAVWIGLQSALPATAWAYAVRTAATAVAGLLACFKLSGARDRSAASCMPCMRNMVAGVIAGLAVCALWIAPDGIEWYRIWLCWPIGSMPEVKASSPYDPAACGWTLTSIKLMGSAFVIAPVEELFFRSFLYRWLQNRDFMSVPLSRFDLSAFVWTVFLFMIEHDRPAAAAMAGVVYGFLAVRFGLGSAIIAHVATNLALGLHVIYHGTWGFW